MESMKIIKELERRGLQFRGEYPIDYVHNLNVMSDSAIGYEKDYKHCKSFLLFAKRIPKEGCKVGDAGTDCSDILISVDETNDDTICHMIYTHDWFIPEVISEGHPDGVSHLSLDYDCHILSCSHSCGCCTSTGYHFDEISQWTKDDKPMTAFDAVADVPCKDYLDLLPETCTPKHVRRFGYRD